MIQSSYLSDLAGYTNTAVAKVVINGTYTITSFDVKHVVGNIFEIKYVIPFGSVATVTQIELKKSSNQVISSNSVTLPINADTVMTQTIEHKEVTA